MTFKVKKKIGLAPVNKTYLYLYKYENVCLCVCECVCVCVCVRVFLGHLESDWDTHWLKCAFWPRKDSKTIIFFLKLFFAELLPLFCIYLRFLCKFEERLQKNQRR